MFSLNNNKIYIYITVLHDKILIKIELKSLIIYCILILSIYIFK